MIIAFSWFNSTYGITIQVEDEAATVWFRHDQHGEIAQFIKVMKQVADITLVFTQDMPTLRQVLVDVEIIKE